MFVISEKEASAIEQSKVVSDQKSIFWNSFKKVKTKYPDIRCKYYYDPDGLLDRISIFTFYGGSPQGFKEVDIMDLPEIHISKDNYTGKTKVGRYSLDVFMDNGFSSPFM